MQHLGKNSVGSGMCTEFFLARGGGGGREFFIYVYIFCSCSQMYSTLVYLVLWRIQRKP